MSTGITNFERDLLRSLDGEDVPGLSWGAAMGEAIEYLREGGYIAEVPCPSGDGYHYGITDKGRAALASGTMTEPTSQQVQR